MPLACLSSLKRSISLSSVTPHPPGFPSAPIAGLLHFQLLFPSLPLSKFWGSSRFLPSPLFFSLYLLPGSSPSFNYFSPHLCPLSSRNLFSSSFPFSENHTDIHPSGQATHASRLLPYFLISTSGPSPSLSGIKDLSASPSQKALFSFIAHATSFS